MSRVALFWTTYLGLGLLCTILELVRPARKLRYWRWDAVPLDVAACVAYQFLFYAVAARVTNPLARYFYLPAALHDVPLAARIAAYYVLGDLGGYWMHRLMHTRHLWRVHRFHHSSTELYWLAGVRATIPQQILFNLPYVPLVPLLFGAPGVVFEGLMVAGVLTNHWMHLNVTWRSNWLEKIFITPRFHHIHHSSDAKLHDGNYGVVFSVWDRLFGTYIDPDKTKVKKYGTGEAKRDPVLLMIGI